MSNHPRIRKALILLGGTLSLSLLGFLAARLLAPKIGSLPNALFYLAIGLFIIGCFSMMQGSPRAYGHNARDFAANNAVQTEVDRGSPDYYRHHASSAVFSFHLCGLVLIFSGILLFLLSLRQQ